MPASIPGFSSYSSFLSLFTPLKSNKNDFFQELISRNSIEIDETWFSNYNHQETLTPFTDDCRQCIKQLICYYGELKQNELIFDILLHFLPRLPVDIIAAAQSLYLAVVHGKNVDFAVLNIFGLSSIYVFNNGNAIAKLALFIKEILSEQLPLNIVNEDTHPAECFFTGFAVLAIVINHWLKDQSVPQRRYMRIPLFLANIVIRSNYYWHQLEYMAQHAFGRCRMLNTQDAESYLCVEDNVGFLPDGKGRIVERNSWTCAVESESPKVQWQDKESCNFQLSAAQLAQVRTDGVVFSRDNVIPQPADDFAKNHAAVSLPETHLQTTAALFLPVLANSRWRGIGQAALGTTMVASLGYASYMMLSVRNKPRLVTMVNQAGSLSADEQTMLREITATTLPWLSSPPTEEAGIIRQLMPFTTEERRLLDKNIKELAQVSANRNADQDDEIAVRRKRDSGQNGVVKRINDSIIIDQPDSRTQYWLTVLDNTPLDSPEREPLRQLAFYKRTSLAAPKESIPSQDKWYTFMDRFDRGAYSNHYFFEKIEVMATEVAHSGVADYPDKKFAPDKWLHLGRFYQAFYLKILSQWATVIWHVDLAMATEYKIASEQVKEINDKIMTYDNSGYNLPQFSGNALLLLKSKVDFLQNLHEKLVKFNRQEQRLLTEKLIRNSDNITRGSIPSKTKLPSKRDASGLIHYLNEINVARFTPSFFAELGTLLESVAHLQFEQISQKGTLNQQLFYIDLSLVSLRRLYDALMDDDREKAYNYAVLDEMVIDIIKAEIAPTGQQPKLEQFMKLYFSYRDDIWPEYQKMLDRLHRNVQPESSTEHQPTQSAPISVANSNKTIPEIFRDIAWEGVWQYVEKQNNNHLPAVRLSMQEAVVAIVQEKFKDYTNKLANIAAAEIFDPARYLDRWIGKIVQNSAGVVTVTPDTIIKVTHYTHLYIKGATTDNSEKSYSLRDIVRGIYRKKNSHTYKIHWPAGIDENKQAMLLNNIDKDIQADIEKAFDNLALRNVYQVMARQVALDYLAQKYKVLGDNREQRSLAQNNYIECVKDFLEGKIKPQLIQWHGECLAGVIFIPSQSKPSDKTTNGVLLSLWKKEHYDIPYPGFSQTLVNPGKTPNNSVEKETPFQALMKKQSVPRITRALIGFEDPFAYQRDVLLTAGHRAVTKGSDILYTAPFNIIDADDYIDELMNLQKKDLIELYDDFIDSKEEFIREQLYELFNVMSMTTGLVLLGMGIVVGGPAWIYTLASLTATLLLEVVPNAVLYAKADDEVEREQYLHSMVMAIGMEVVANVPKKIITNAVNLVLLRVIRQGMSAANTSLQPLTVVAEKLLKQIAEHVNVERVRYVAERVHFISKLARDELENIIADLDKEIANVPPVSKKKISPPCTIFCNGEEELELPRPVDVAMGSILPGKSSVKRQLIEEKAHWQSVNDRLHSSDYNSWYRAVLRWNNVEQEVVNVEYMVVAQKQQDIIVITRLEGQGNSAYLYHAETEWVKNIREVAENNNALVKYIDFIDFNVLAKRHPEIIEHMPMPADKYIKRARTLFAPLDYQEMIKARVGMDYNDIQHALSKLQRLKELRPNAKKGNKNVESASATSSEQSLKQSTPSETYRHLTAANYVADDFTKDFDAIELLSEFKKKPGIQSKLADPKAILLPLDAFILGRGFRNIRFRRVFIWDSATSMPLHHYVLLGMKNDIEYVFDLKVPFFKWKLGDSSSALIMRETDWALKYIKSKEKCLIKYKDSFSETTAITQYNYKSATPEELIDGATILNMPDWYLLLKEAAVEKLAEFPESPLPVSNRLRQDIPYSQHDIDGASVVDFTMLDEPVMRDYKLAQSVAAVQNIGPDISQFYPLPPLLSKEYQQALAKLYTQNLNKGNTYYMVSNNLVELANQQGLPGTTQKIINSVFEGFNTSYEILKKMVALMDEAATNADIKSQVVGRLAMFLNEKNWDILAEAYVRLAEIIKRTHDLAHFHVVETRLNRVIPMSVRKEAESAIPPIYAYVYESDPTARIMIVLDNWQNANLPGTVIHELTHLSVGTLDTMYLKEPIGIGSFTGHKTPSIEKAHGMFGMNLFHEPGLQFAFGNNLIKLPSAIVEPLSYHEKMVAQARIMRLPMLRANTKMNNADSIVVLLNDLLQNFEFIPDIESTWKVKVAAGHKKTRTKRKTTNKWERDIIDKVYLEEILSTIIIQAGQIAIDDLLSGEVLNL